MRRYDSILLQFTPFLLQFAFQTCLEGECFQVSMATKMATVAKAEELLEKIRAASWDAAVKGNMLA